MSEHNRNIHRAEERAEEDQWSPGLLAMDGANNGAPQPDFGVANQQQELHERQRNEDRAVMAAGDDANLTGTRMAWANFIRQPTDYLVLFELNLSPECIDFLMEQTQTSAPLAAQEQQQQRQYQVPKVPRGLWMVESSLNNHTSNDRVEAARERLEFWFQQEELGNHLEILVLSRFREHPDRLAQMDPRFPLQLLPAVPALTQLQELTLVGLSLHDTQALWTPILSSCPLRRLHIGQCELDPTTLQGLGQGFATAAAAAAAIVDQNTNKKSNDSDDNNHMALRLSHLCLERIVFHDPQNLECCLLQFSSLRVLSLSRCKLSLSCLPLLGQVIACHDHLESLHLAHNPNLLLLSSSSSSSKKQVKSFLNAWQNHAPRLNRLSIDGCGLTERVAGWMFDAWEQNMSLQHLSLKDNPDLVICDWVQSIPKIRNLQSLQLPRRMSLTCPRHYELRAAVGQSLSLVEYSEGILAPSELKSVFRRNQLYQKCLTYCNNDPPRQRVPLAVAGWPRLLKRLSVNNGEGTSVWMFLRAKLAPLLAEDGE